MDQIRLTIYMKYETVKEFMADIYLVATNQP